MQLSITGMRRCTRRRVRDIENKRTQLEEKERVLTAVMEALKRYSLAAPRSATSLCIMDLVGNDTDPSRVLCFPSVNVAFSPVILLTAQYAPSSSLSVGILVSTRTSVPTGGQGIRLRVPTVSAERTTIRRPSISAPLVSRSPTRLHLAENPDQRPNPL
jgi:hypothetical protein